MKGSVRRLTLRLFAIVFFSLFVIFYTCNISVANWNQVRSTTDDLVLGYDQVDRVVTIFAIDKITGDIFKYDGSKIWRKIGGPGAQFVVGKGVAGTVVYGLSPDKSAVMHYQGNDGWNKIGGEAKKLYGGYGGLYGISPSNGDIYSYDSQTKKWTKVGGPAKMLAVGGEGELYGISPDSKGVYRYLGQPGKWERIWNSAGEIYAAPGYLYGTDTMGNIYKYEGKPQSWTQIGGPGKMFSATADGDLYGLSPDGNGIYRYLGSPGKWERVGNKAKLIYARKDMLFSIRQDNTLWQYKRDTLPNNANLLLITQNKEITAAVTDFVDYKRQYGFSVAVVTLNTILKVAQGEDEAEKIRNYLMDIYKGGLLHYVLLVGDVNTIPTKVFFASNRYPGQINRARLNAYTTDFYFGNLHTTDWDLDNDDLWGEISDDNLNIHYDVVVSRIPFNDGPTVKQVLDNMISFSEENGQQWQRRVILAHGFLSRGDDSAVNAERIDKDFFQPKNFQVEKLYVNMQRTRSIFFDPQRMTALTNDSYVNSLSRNGQGLVILAAHGAVNCMESHYTTNGTPAQDTRFQFGLQDDISAQPLSGLFLLNGCNTAPTITANGYSTTTTLDDDLDTLGSKWSSIGNPVLANIAKTYLSSGASAVIASTVGSDSTGNTLEYELVKELIENGLSIGDAFVIAKERAGSSRAAQSFYLVGDPTLKIR